MSGAHPPTVLHLHVPRSGGTSVGQALTAALSDRGILRVDHRRDLVAALKDGAEFGLVAGHFQWGLHDLLPDHIYFIVLRDPLERVRSLYDFIRMKPFHRQHRLFASNSLESLLQRPNMRTFFSSGQVRQIAPQRRGGKEPGTVVLERAWENLCRDDVVVAFTDGIGEGLERLGDRIGRRIRPPRKSLNRMPRTPVPEGVLDDLRRLNELDIELYRRTREKFAPAMPSTRRKPTPTADMARNIAMLVRRLRG